MDRWRIMFRHNGLAEGITRALRTDVKPECERLSEA